MAVEDLLVDLDPEQRQVAMALRGPVRVIAGAGTGKTRAITHRIAYGVATGVYKPSEVLAVTFTTRAAGEMRERLRVLGAGGVQARTFHSAALRQLRYFWPSVYGTTFPEIVASKFGLVAESARRIGVSGDRAVLRDLAAEIEWAKVCNVRPVDYVARAAKDSREVSEVSPDQVAALMSAYEEIKRDAHRIDMEDILLICSAILADDERIAAQVRSQYRWFVVDEFQDVNPLQASLLDLWLGGRDEICVVGDPNQAIYSFAGAAPGILTSFTRRHESSARIELVRNYRSTPQIVAAANAVFGSGGPGVAVVSQNEPGPPVTWKGHNDDQAEAGAVAAALLELHEREGIAWRDMAVLFRINAQSEVFEEALGELSVPFVLRGVEGFFQRNEVRQAVTLLRGAAKADDKGSGNLADDVRAVVSAMNHSDTPPAGRGAVRDRWESLQALVQMAEDLYARSPQATLLDLIADLERRADQAHAPSADGVTLATLHAAKGLEWEAVFCAGMREGMMPIVYADSPEAVAEERRLFYVGLTRAKRHLTVSWASRRDANAKGQRQPSRFVVDLLPATHPARPASQSIRRKGPAQPPGDHDPIVFDRLRQWRKQRAAELGKPAFTVFTDDTLRELASVKPRSLRDLEAVRGIGPAKLERFGADVLDVLADPEG